MKINYTDCNQCSVKEICRFKESYLDYIPRLGEAIGENGPANVDAVSLVCRYFRQSPQYPRFEDYMIDAQQTKIDMSRENIDRLAAMNPTFLTQPQQQAQQTIPRPTPEQLKEMLGIQSPSKAMSEGQNGVVQQDPASPS